MSVQKQTQATSVSGNLTWGSQVLVTGHGPFDGLGVVFGGAASTSKPAKEKVPAKARVKSISERLSVMTILTGIMSVSLYFLLYEFQGDIVRLADLTRHGDKVNFIIPILIALVFSLIHGSFTERFWAVLGLKPKHH